MSSYANAAADFASHAGLETEVHAVLPVEKCRDVGHVLIEHLGGKVADVVLTLGHAEGGEQIRQCAE